MRKPILSILTLSFPFILLAQDNKDSTVNLQPIDLKIHFAKQSALSSTSSIHTLSEAAIQQQQPNSFLSSINTIPGIRMEERSPGSFRLAMRGSLIRSPFGIRNTKIYLDEFPLTDAGGNSYLNLIDPAAVQSLMLIKGPDGSLYGANSGGVVKIQPKGFGIIEDKTELNLLGGSFGTFQQSLGIQRLLSPKYQFSINQSFARSDGYRDNTALNKKSIQTSHQWNYSPTGQFRIMALYTDLFYQTPGGLTLQQYEENPKQARPAAGSNPSAQEQHAAIYNKTFFGGIAHSKHINEQLSHHISLFGSKTDFKNPFISNYEFRKESNLGLRSYLSWSKKERLQMQLGFEAAWATNKIENFDNNKGEPGMLQAKDDLNNQTWNIFYRTQFEILKNWHIEGSLGLNINSIDFHKIYPSQEQGSIDFKKDWMPRLATNYTWSNMAFRASYSKGYSTPTLAEVRASDNIINTSLQAEKGNNYEIGYRIKTNNQNLIFDLSYYDYRMKNGIIRQIKENGEEYYSNVGQMKQKGLEGTLWLHIPLHKQWIKAIQYQSGLAYNHYRFGHYNNNGKDLIHNKITAVPDWVWTNTIQLDLIKHFGLNIYHNYTSSAPLNDINTVFAKKYNLLQAKIIWNTKKIYHTKAQIYFGLDNILNEKYSLGNDINAFAGRFYNAAPTRNFYAGVKLFL